MPRMRKKTRREDGPRATITKLEDARTLLARMRRALDKEILERADDLDDAEVGWTHFGAAARLREDLKEVGQLLLIDRNEVDHADGCPCCGTHDVDRLRLAECEVQCTICGCEYSLD